jgi:hypothetical protein
VRNRTNIKPRETVVDINDRHTRLERRRTPLFNFVAQ